TDGCRALFAASPRSYVTVRAATRLTGDRRVAVSVSPDRPAAGDTVLFALEGVRADGGLARLYEGDRAKALEPIEAALHPVGGGALAFQRRLERPGEWRLVIQVTSGGERVQATFAVTVEPVRALSWEGERGEGVSSSPREGSRPLPAAPAF